MACRKAVPGASLDESFAPRCGGAKREAQSCPKSRGQRESDQRAAGGFGAIGCRGTFLKNKIWFHPVMSKNARKIKKANHGKRPASSKARRAKRRAVRT